MRRLFWYHFRFGLRERIPLCCVVRFSYVHVYTSRLNAVERGIRYYSRGVYVPCGVLHRKHRELHES